MGRITRSPPKAKPRFQHEVRVRSDEAGPELWREVARFAGPAGYKKRSPFWAFIVVSFGSEQAATAFRQWRDRRRHEAELRELARRPCPVRARYEKAARDRHAVLWGLSTGIIRDVVRVYRTARRESSTHAGPNMAAAEVIVALAPAIPLDQAREMVDAMLAWTIERHGAWFWAGMAGQHQADKPYA